MAPRTRLLRAAATGAVLLLVLALHGAVPFLAVPAFGQALWTSGFAQSFVNATAIYATNFGAPSPAPIAFGLAGAVPSAAFIALGLHPVDAYAAMTALWLGVAFFGARALARTLGLRAPLDLAAAMLWLMLPIVWAHGEYSMLSLGFALLPLYYWRALAVLQPGAGAGEAALYVLACVVAVFMDGYTFVMFVAAASLLGACQFAASAQQRRALLGFALPVHVLGVGAAYGLYTAYVGGAGYQPAGLDVFRAWGADVAFLVRPTEGVHWLPDLLGASVPRSEEEFFGDWSVWCTTFALPLLATAAVAWWRSRRFALATSGALILLLGLYLALGPSLKIQATKPAGEALGRAMPARFASVPTGSAWLSSSVPGLRDMRAAYRWLGLASLGAWLLLLLWLADARGKEAAAAAALAGAVLVLNMPHAVQKWRGDAAKREMFLRIDAELLRDLAQTLKPRERVAFLPYRNDLLANYLAARLELVAYNIGGDKNLEAARRHWPETLRQLRRGVLEEGFAEQVLLLLARREADAVVLPYLDLEIAGQHRWPRPLELRDSLRPVLAELRDSGFAAGVERDQYAVVRLNDAAMRTGAAILEERVLQKLCSPPVCIRETGLARTASSAGETLYAGRPAAMAAGHFRLEVLGTVDAGARAWVEVVSAAGAVRHARRPLAAAPGGRLAEVFLVLGARAEDLQVRVTVEAGRVRLDGYALLPRLLQAAP